MILPASLPWVQRPIPASGSPRTRERLNTGVDTVGVRFWLALDNDSDTHYVSLSFSLRHSHIQSSVDTFPCLHHLPSSLPTCYQQDVGLIEVPLGAYRMRIKWRIPRWVKSVACVDADVVGSRDR